MPYTVGRQDRGDIQITYEPMSAGNGIQLKVNTSLERLYGERIREEIMNSIREMKITAGKFIAVDDGALPYVIRARVEAVIRLAKEETNEG